MNCKSIRLNADTLEQSIVSTESVSIATSRSLAMFRGQAFFTSAFTIRNANGIFLVGLDSHYHRFVRCYQRMFERSVLPLTYQQFTHLVDTAIQENKTLDVDHLHCVIMAIPGASRVQQEENSVYGNGFGGDIVEYIAIINTFKPKPTWCYTQGIHGITMPFQRVLASAKPTSYLGGVAGQHQLDTLNLLTWGILNQNKVSCQDAKRQAFQLYQSLSIYQAYSVRLCCRDVFEAGLAGKSPDDIPVTFGDSPQEVNQVMQTAHHSKGFAAWYQKSFKDLFHEAIFTTIGQSKNVLEGTTFSLMGINKNDECIFIPLEGNVEQEDDLNTGYVLEGTTIAMLQHIAATNAIPYKVMSVSLEALHDFKAVYCVSTTRFMCDNGRYHLQPFASINSRSLTQESSPTYDQLMTALGSFMDQYHMGVSIGSASPLRSQSQLKKI